MWVSCCLLPDSHFSETITFLFQVLNLSTAVTLTTWVTDFQSWLSRACPLRKATSTAKRSNTILNSYNHPSCLPQYTLFKIFSLLSFYSLLPYHFSLRSHHLHSYRPFYSRLKTVHLDLHPIQVNFDSDTDGPTHASFLPILTTENRGTCESTIYFHLQEREAYGTMAMTPAACCVVEIGWWYTTDLHLPPWVALAFCPRDDSDEQVWDYKFKDDTGKVITGRGTQEQMEMHKASRCRQAEAT